MHVLVTGSSGQIGSYTVEALQAADHAVTGLDREPSRWTDVVQDIRGSGAAGGGSGAAGELDPEDRRRLEGTEAVVHLAAQVSVARSVEDPREDASHNVDGSLAVLELARHADVERFVFISSAAVYGDPEALPITEDHPRAPRSPYGLSKAVGEDYARLYADLYGLPVVVLRPFNVYSARQDPSNPYSGVISAFAGRLAAGEPPVVHGDGSQTRDFVHATDVVAAIELVLEHPQAGGGTFNVGTGRETSVLQLAETMIERAAGLDGLPVEPGMDPIFGKPREGDIDRSLADVSRIAELGFQPRTEMGQALDEILTQAG